MSLTPHTNTCSTPLQQQPQQPQQKRADAWNHQVNHDIHKQHLDRFVSFIQKKSVPNILVYGPVGSGKKHLVSRFMHTLYDHDQSSINSNILYVDCINGKGINFIRDELKLFAKTNVNPQYFKSIILLLIDKLTIDAQSALRRCIELYNHNTRFFAIVNNKSTIIKPLLSRFCEMRISLPLIQNQPTNLHEYFRPQSDIVEQNKVVAMNEIEKICHPLLMRTAAMSNHNNNNNQNHHTQPQPHVECIHTECIRCADELNALGILATDLVEFLNERGFDYGISEYESSIVLSYHMKCRRYIRSERFLLFSILYAGVIRRTTMIDNIALL